MRLDESDAQHASRSWWDGDAGRYHREHQGYFDTFYWCPERVTEEDADLLGDLTDLDVLEVGSVFAVACAPPVSSPPRRF